MLGTKHNKWSVGFCLIAILLVCSAAVVWAEESGFNLLTSNLATVAYDTIGFAGATGGGTTPVVARDTTQAWEGNASLRVTGDGSKRGQGIWIASTFVPSNRGTYTFSGYIKSQPGDSWYVLFEEKGIGGTGVKLSQEMAPFKIEGTEWQRFSATVTMQTGDSLGVTLRHDTATPFDIWVDGLQLEVGDKVTAWNTPRTTKNQVNYNQATLAYDTRGFVNVGAATLTRDTVQTWEGNASLKVEGSGSAKDQGIYMWPTYVPTVGSTYTFSVYLNGKAGDEFYLGVQEKITTGTSAAGTPLSGQPFTLKGDGWERYTITTTVQSGQWINLTLKHTTAAPFVVNVGGVQLETGDQATAWVAPAKP